MRQRIHSENTVFPTGCIVHACTGFPDSIKEGLYFCIHHIYTPNISIVSIYLFNKVATKATEG